MWYVVTVGIMLNLNLQTQQKIKRSGDKKTKSVRIFQEFARHYSGQFAGNECKLVIFCPERKNTFCFQKIRTEIFEMLKDCLTKVAETEGAILEDLHNLD